MQRPHIARVATLVAFLALAPASGAQAQQAEDAASAYGPKTWDVPFGARTRPRDPYADAQGRVWFVGQAGNYIAYMDAKSGEFKRFAIDSGTHPHNLVVHNGQVWFTGNRNNRLVRLDPATGRLTTFRIPEGVRDPHTMIFDPKRGVAWFTAQQAGVIGRFDPETGQFRLWRTGERSRPYGVVVDSKGNPWVDLFGTNRIATIDARTNELRTYTLPNERARPRRIAITSDDQVYWGDYTRGYLGHLDPRTGRMQEWPLPLAARALPYAMTTDDRNVVWVAQNGYDGIPATLVAFDPTSKQFVAEVPVGRPAPNTIRHMTFDPATRQIWFGTDQGAIGKVSVPRASVIP